MGRRLLAWKVRKKLILRTKHDFSDLCRLIKIPIITKDGGELLKLNNQSSKKLKLLLELLETLSSEDLVTCKYREGESSDYITCVEQGPEVAKLKEYLIHRGEEEFLRYQLSMQEMLGYPANADICGIPSEIHVLKTFKEKYFLGLMFERDIKVVLLTALMSLLVVIFEVGCEQLVKQK